MKIIKRFLKYTLIAILLLVLVLISLPFLFEDKIQTIIKEEINDSLNAKVDFTDVDLSFISDFPDVEITIEDLEIMGIDQFENYPLLKVQEASVSVDFWSVIKASDKHEIQSFGLKKGDIHLKVLNNGSANYDITKNKETVSDDEVLVMSVQNYSLKDMNISYLDRSTQLDVELSNLNHEGSGDFSSDQLILNTRSDAKISMKSEGVSYLNGAFAEWDSKMNLDLVNSKYSFLENTLKLNLLRLNVDGDIALKKKGIDVNLDLKAPENDFKGLMSVVPATFNEEFNQLQASGQTTFIGSFKGLYNAENKLYPAFNIHATVKDGVIKPLNVNNQISDCNIDFEVKSKSNLEGLEINIKPFDFKLDGKPISGYLSVNEELNDPRIDGAFKGNIDLNSLSKSLNHNQTSLSGLLDLDVMVNAKYSDIENGNYSAILFKGKGDVENLSFESDNNPKVSCIHITSDFSPEFSNLEAKGLKIGKSTGDLKTKITNPLGFLIKDNTPIVNVHLDSDQIYLDELESFLVNDTEMNSDTLDVEPINLEATLQTKVKNIHYEDYHLTDHTLEAKFSGDELILSEFRTNMGDNDIHLSGKLNNIQAYSDGSSPLEGNLILYSDHIDSDDFMSSGEESNSEEIILVPQNMNVDLTSSIKDLDYGDINLKNVKSQMVVRDETIEMKEVNANGLGGEIIFSGLYSTKVDKKNPDFSLKYELSKLAFNETVNKILTIEKLAPVMKFLNGFFNSTLVMDGKLGKGMLPQLSSLNASGFIETINGSLNKFGPVEKLSNKLNIGALSQMTIEDTRNWFEIKDGHVYLKEFDYEHGGVEMKISGDHSLDQEMNYSLLSKIPRSLLKENSATALADEGLKFIEKEASKLGLNIDQGDYLHLDIKMTGSINNPKIKITPIRSDGSSMKDHVKDAVNQKKDEIKDSIQTKVNETIDSAKDSLENRVNEEIEKAKDKAQEKTNEIVDSTKVIIKEKVGEQVDTVLKQTGLDSLGQKVTEGAKDVLGNKADEGIDKLKDKLKDFNPFKKKKKN